MDIINETIDPEAGTANHESHPGSSVGEERTGGRQHRKRVRVRHRKLRKAVPLQKFRKD